MGIITGILWLGFPVVIMKLVKVIGFDGKNDIPFLFVWILAAFLNVIMQELLVRGWLCQMLVHIRNYNEMLSIRIENSMDKEVRIKNGRPVSTGGKGNGISCLNVQRCVEKYGGSVLYKNGNGKFYIDVILNR